MLIHAERMWLGPGRIRRGWSLRVRGDRIEAVGPTARLRSRRDPEEFEWDHGRSVLLPGLVVAHAHLELGALGGTLSGQGGFVPWVRRVRETRARREAELGILGWESQVRRAVRLAARNLVHHGVTAVLDLSNTGLSAEVLAHEPLHTVAALECIGLDPASAPRILERAWAYVLGRAGKLQRRIAIPHAPYSCSGDLLRGLADPALHAGIPGLHLAESAHEAELFRTGTGPMRTLVDEICPEHDILPGESVLDRLEHFYPPRPGFVAAHGYELGALELDRLSRRGTGIVLCPQSARHLMHRSAPVEELHRLRMRVGLGVDSQASNRWLSPWKEMSTLLLGHPVLPPGQILEWATSGGADLLGHDAGRLVEGAIADVIAVDVWEDIADEDLEQHLVRDEPSVRAVAVAGRKVLG